MKTLRHKIAGWAPLLVAWLLALPAQGADQIRVLVVTGGHGYETNQFLTMFKELPGITFESVAHPQAHDWLKPEAAKQWDVLVTYDMWQDITDEAKANFVNRLKEGKGLVALHHSLASYQAWDQYARIIGGKYHLEKYTRNGVERPGSTYRHDVHFKLHVADPNHPVTRGLSDFEIHDETYGKLEIRPRVHALLTTTEPTSSPTVAWAKRFQGTRVVTIQLGHDHTAYENPNYRRLLNQAIQWVAQHD